MTDSRQSADVTSTANNLVDRGPVGQEETGPVSAPWYPIRGVTRPVWEPNAKTMALYEAAKRIAKTIGIDLAHESSGGGSDSATSSPWPTSTTRLSCPRTQLRVTPSRGPRFSRHHVEEAIYERSVLEVHVLASASAAIIRAV